MVTATGKQTGENPHLHRFPGRFELPGEPGWVHPRRLIAEGRKRAGLFHGCGHERTASIVCRNNRGGAC